MGPTELYEVVVSGTVGKQVFSSAQPRVLKSVVLYANASAATCIIRDGNASGTVRLTLKQGVGGSNLFPFCGVRFDKGMHVKVTGTGGLAYLEIQ